MVGKSQQKISLLPVVENEKWGFIDKYGKIIITPSYHQVGSFKGAYATVQKDNLYYLLDSTGRLIFKDGYADINFVNNKFVALTKKNIALADISGKIHSSFIYSLILDKNFYTLVLEKDSSFYDLFNTTTGVLLVGKFDKIITNGKDHFIEVRVGDKVGLLDSLHQYILNPVLGDQAFLDKKVSVVKTKKGFQFYTTKEKICGDTLFWKYYKVLSDNYVEVWNHPARKYILSLRAEKQFPYKNFITCEAIGQLLLVTNGIKKGLINPTGEIIFPIEYDRIELWEDSTIRLYKGNEIGVISYTGKEIFATQFDWVEQFDKNGIALATKNNLWGLISKTGKVLVPFDYSGIEITSESWKCYKNNSLDLYMLSSVTTVDELLHFNNVSFLSVQKKKYRNYAFSKIVDATSIRGLYRSSSKGNYALTSKSISYTSSSKIKCLISKNYLNVERLFGFYDCIKKRTISLNNYWDIQIEELEEQEYARVILTGDRQALISRRGELKTMFPIMRNTKTVLTSITYIGPFVNGLARINLGGSFIEGNDLHDSYRATFTNHALSCSGGLWGYVNGKGELSIKASYEYVSDFFNGKAIVKEKGMYGVIDTLNQYIIKPNYNFISFLENSGNNFFKLVLDKKEYGVLNDEGRVIIEAQYRDIGALRENRIPVMNNGIWGAYDFSGRLVIPFKYHHLSSFYEGKAWYKENGKWSFIDSMGTKLFVSSFIEVRHFSNGYAAIRSKGKWGFINSKGILSIPPVYSKVGYFNDNITSVSIKKKWWFIDTEGKKISRHWFNKVNEFDQYGLSIVQKKRNYFLFNKENGKMLVGVKYKLIAPFFDGLAKVKDKSNKIGYIDTLGKIVIPLNYFGGGDFHDGLIRVRYANGKWGYIDKNNNSKINPEYQLCEDFSEGKATVSTGKNTIVIDTKGMKIETLPEKKLGLYKEGLLLIDGTYYNSTGKKEMGKFISAQPFKDGLANVKFTERQHHFCRLINRKNNTIATYSSISDIENKRAVFTISSRIGLADSNGTIILPPVYQNIIYVGENIFQINSFDAIGYLKQDGNWLWKPQK